MTRQRFNAVNGFTNLLLVPAGDGTETRSRSLPLVTRLT